MVTGQTVEIGELRRDELPRAAAVVAAAMQELPYMGVIWPGTGPERRARIEHVMQLLLPTLKHPGLAARIDGRLVGVVGLAPPGTCVPPVSEGIGLSLRIALAGPGAFLRMNAYFAAAARYDPRIPHWHVGPVAVLPEEQGKGIGTKLMIALARLLDQQGAVAHLETDRPGNVPFYQRAGFTVVEEVEIMGVRNWFMRRYPP